MERSWPVRRDVDGGEGRQADSALASTARRGRQVDRDALRRSRRPADQLQEETGRSDPKAHGKLSKILDAEERKTPTKAVTEVVKAVSKEAVKVVSKGTGKGTDK
jgi:hypothetical protein